MTIETKPFNPMDYLQNDEEISAYLTSTYMDDDPKVFLIALGHVIRHRGVSQVAEAAGVDAGHLEAILSGRAGPDWPTIHRVLKALGIRIQMAA